MPGKNEVNLTFAGDTTKLESAFDRVGSASKKMSDKVGTASKSVDDHGNKMKTMGEKADNSERNLIGIHDVIDGTATIMQGPGKAGMVAYIQGWADLAGGVAPLLTQLGNVNKAMIRNTLTAVKSAIRTGASWVVMGVTAMANAITIAAAWLISLGPAALVVAAIGLVVVAFVILWKKSEKFRDFWKAVWSAIKDVVMAGVRFVVNTFLTLVGTILNGAAKAFGWIPGLGGKLKNAAKEFEAFKRHVNDSLNGIKDKNVTVKIDAKMTATAKKIIGGNLSDASINAALKKQISIGAKASGGPVLSGQMYLVGENGPELLTMGGQSGFITPNSSLPPSASPRLIGNGGGITVTVEAGRNSGSSAEQFLVQFVLEAIRTKKLLLLTNGNRVVTARG